MMRVTALRMWRPAHGATLWSLAWQRVAAAVALAAALTGVAAAALGGSIWHTYGAVAYIGVAILALFSPAAISAQVIGGLLLAGSLLLADDAPFMMVILLMFVSIVATAELLAIAARLANRIERDARNDLRRGALAALLAGGVFGLMLLIGALPGPASLPTGILAIGVASGACVLLAIVFVSSRFAPRE